MSRALISIATGLGSCIGTVTLTCASGYLKALPFNATVTMLATSALGLKAIQACREGDVKTLTNKDYVIIGGASFIGASAGGAALVAFTVVVSAVSASAFFGSFFGSYFGNAFSVPFSLFGRRPIYYY